MRFWSDAKTEIKLAADAGVKEFRLGVDWGRLVLKEPLAGTEAVVRLESVPVVIRSRGFHNLKSGQDLCWLLGNCDSLGIALSFLSADTC